MGNNNKESFKPFHYSTEGEIFFSDIVNKYGLKEDIEHIIIPLINNEGEEKETFILKTEKVNLEDETSPDMEDYIKLLIDKAAKDGFSIKTNEAQEIEAA